MTFWGETHRESRALHGQLDACAGASTRVRQWPAEPIATTGARTGWDTESRSCACLHADAQGQMGTWHGKSL